jgi:hypothetical protein
MCAKFARRIIATRAKTAMAVGIRIEGMEKRKSTGICAMNVAFVIIWNFNCSEHLLIWPFEIKNKFPDHDKDQEDSSNICRRLSTDRLQFANPLFCHNFKSNVIVSINARETHESSSACLNERINTLLI